MHTRITVTATLTGRATPTSTRQQKLIPTKTSTRPTMIMALLNTNPTNPNQMDIDQVTTTAMIILGTWARQTVTNMAHTRQQPTSMETMKPMLIPMRQPRTTTTTPTRARNQATMHITTGGIVHPIEKDSKYKPRMWRAPPRTRPTPTGTLVHSKQTRSQ